jgi:RNA polymerase sigma-70 factor, ECF subfamily
MDLLARFARGDDDAFESLFRRFQAPVYGWIVRIVRDRTAAEDLTVETFWRIHQARARFDPARGFEGWARRVATNLALSHLRAARPLVPLEEGEVSAGDPGDPAVDRETREQLQRAFAGLSPTLRVTATLALIEETPYREIAAALGVTENAVKLRVFRAVRELRRSLQRMGVEP